MAINRELPGSLERFDIEPARKLIDQLIHVGAGLRLEQTMEQHAVLHRRSRICILDIVPARHNQRLQLLRFQPGER